jgi:hypothetical protein
VAREFAVLLYSDRLYGWLKLNNTSPKYAYYRLNQPSYYSESDTIDADAKSVGCKFTTEKIRDNLLQAAHVNPSNSLVEHCWSLSNSCGEFIDPNDIRRFKKLTFGEVPVKVDESVNTGTRVGNYLAHCVNLFDKSLTESNKGRTTMLESYAEKIREYYKTSDLLYLKPTDNILLTGIIYDFLVHYNVSLSTYKSDVDNFNVFLNTYAPLIAEVWDFKWLSSPPDVRLLFEFTAQDLHVSLPYYNINDAKVIIGNTLRFVESVIQKGPLSGLKERLTAVLTKDNPSFTEEDLWAAFHCYYGVYRTGQTRVVPRPLTFVTPMQLGRRSVNMSGVEATFDKLQKGERNINVRRQFCGSLAPEAFATFRRNGIMLPRISTLNIPVRLGYLNVDYYKHVPAEHLTEEERVVLANVNRNVDELCVNKSLSTAIPYKGARDVNHRKMGLGHALRNRPTDNLSPIRKLTRELWDGVRRPGSSQGRSERLPSGFKLS